MPNPTPISSQKANALPEDTKNQQSQPVTTSDPLVSVGRIRRAVGLDGSVEVELYSGDLSRMTKGATFVAGERDLIVEKASPGRKGSLRVRFKGIEDRNAADLIRGIELEIPESAIPPAPDGTYYHYQIIDSSVVDSEGRQIGSVSGIMETGSNDVYVVSKPGGKDILIPATRNSVLQVDIVSRVITVDLSAEPVEPPVEQNAVDEEND